jgi:hypothetical protein
MRMPCLRVLTLVAGIVLMSNPLTAQEGSSAGQHGAVWNLGKLDNGKRYPTTVSAKNQNCRGKRTFEIEVSGEIAQFLHITGPKRLERIGRGKVKTTAAVVDLVNAAPGQYEGLITVRCLDCSPACHQDYTAINVLLQVVGPAAPTMPAEIKSSPPASVQGPTICPKALDPCAELLEKAQALEEEAATARARARALAENQDWEDSQARMDEQEASSDDAFANKLRDQARQWRELADSARQSAATNTRRAGEYPNGSKYNQDWKSEARSDEATAARRDEHADELEKRADELDKGSKTKRDKAEARRRAAEQAQQEADAKTEAADAARKAYDDCVEKAREECERMRSQPRPTTGGSSGTSSGPGSGAGTSTGGGTPGGGGTTPSGPTAAAPAPFLPAFKTQPAKISKVCNWVEYELPPGQVVTYVQVRRARASDDQTVIRIKKASGNLARSVSFNYHCDHPGTAVITYRTASNKAFKFRVLCAE